MTAYGRAAATRVKMRSRARKEVSNPEVRGYYKQFAKQNILNVDPGLITKFLISLK